MNKHIVHQLILDKLRVDLDIAERAAQTAYETATHEENIAENKYDTLGLEASYLAAGQAKRVEEIRQSLALCQNLTLRAYDESRGIEVGSLLGLEDEKGREQWLFLAPDAAGLKVDVVGQPITVITRARRWATACWANSRAMRWRFWWRAPGNSSLSPRCCRTTA